MLILRDVYYSAIDENGEERLFSANEIISEDEYLERLFAEDSNNDNLKAVGVGGLLAGTSAGATYLRKTKADKKARVNAENSLNQINNNFKNETKALVTARRNKLNYLKEQAKDEDRLNRDFKKKMGLKQEQELYNARKGLIQQENEAFLQRYHNIKAQYLKDSQVVRNQLEKALKKNKKSAIAGYVGAPLLGLAGYGAYKGLSNKNK